VEAAEDRLESVPVIFYDADDARERRSGPGAEFVEQTIR
jgi:hypothetical protein